MQKAGSRKTVWPLYISIVVITSVALLISVLLIKLCSDKNVQNHVYGEMQIIVKTQAEIINTEITDQVKPLNMLTEYITDMDTFMEETERRVLEAVKKDNRFCALGFADLSGNAVNYNGSSIGNISNRDYYKCVVSEETASFVEYLPYTLRVPEPRFLFSIPVYDNGKISGVLFASKEESVISDVLLSGSLFDGSERIYITDGDYNVLAANDKADEELKNNDLTAAFQFIRDSSTHYQGGGYMEEEDAYVVSSPVGVNDWQIVCVLDRINAETVFNDLTSLEYTTRTIVIILITVLAYTVIMTYYRIHKYSLGEQQMYTQYSGYRSLLNRTSCAFVEYNIRTDVISANEYFLKKYAGQQSDNQPITMEMLSNVHPEFNFKELDEAIEHVLQSRRPYNYETAITLEEGKVYWIELTLMPQTNLAGNVTEILAAIVDTTSKHLRNENGNDINYIPNGIHRCHLSDPIHLEFASQGMCKMLGYTEQKLMEQLAPDQKLYRIVHPDDQEDFRNFIRKAAEKEGRYRCEYRLCKNDGTYITVLDVMEVKKAFSGTLYGYSSMTDISEFHHAEEIATTKLRAAEAEIEKHIALEKRIIAEKTASEEQYKKEALKLLEKNRINQQEANRLVRAISSINSDYSSIFFADLDTDRYQLCRASDMLRKPVAKIAGTEGQFSVIMKKYIETFVEDGDKERLYDETDIQTLKNKLSNNQISLHYRLQKNSDGQVHYEMHIVDCSDSTDEHQIAVGFRCLDETIAEEEKRRMKLETLENELHAAQMKNSMSQMQPHFLYNALASIREVVLDDPEYASDLIYDFSTHLRACIRAMSHSDLIPFDQELDNIKAYVSIEKMRFGDKLNITYDIKDKDFFIVPLSIQPLVENAIRHGIYERGAKGGTVAVKSALENGKHVIAVSDDGVGFDYAKLQQEVAEKKRDSTGLANLTFRLKQMMNADIAVNSTPGDGTIIIVSIPAG